MKDKQQTFEIELATYKHPRSILAEAFRTLRTNLSFAAVKSPFRSVLVTSALAGEGKTTVAANLSIVLAQAGHRVLLLDCDLRLPAQHWVFGLDNRQGLTNVLVKQLDPVTVAQPGPVPGLSILTSGPVPPNPADLLGSEQMRSLWPRLYENFDHLVVDSPPVLSVTDAVLLASQVDGVLLVARTARTRIENLQEAKAQLARAGTSILGVVLNRAPLPRGSQGYYYGAYRYQTEELYL
ncbi:MAG: CpsD/CapB family tyrosine-protein kinase [Bacillota bacterium]